MDKHTTRSFKGFETWMSVLLMNLKMIKWLVASSAFVSIIFTTFLFSYLGDVNLHFFKIPDKSIWSVFKEVFQVMYYSLLHNDRLLFHRAGDSFLSLLLLILPYYFLCFIILFLLFSILFIYYFRKRSVKQQEDKYLGGAKFISDVALKKLLKKVNTRIPIADLEIPINDETKHYFIVGRTGSGKTQTLKRVVTYLQNNNRKIILYDNKGDYIPTNYNEKTDLIFNPIDERTVRWSIFNDCDSKMDIEQVICHGLIPGTGGSRDAFWANAAREVFKGILYYLYRVNKGKVSNQAIWGLLSSGSENIIKALKSIPEGAVGRDMILDSNSKQTQGIMAMLLQYTAILEMMSVEDGDFSIRKWLTDDQPGTLFLVNQSKSKDVLKPILTLMLDMASHEVLGMPDDYDRRIYFFLDEFGSLNYMSSIIELLTRARSKGASVWIGTQEIGQIEKVYGKELRASIVNGCASKLILSIAEPETAKYFSQSIGDTEILESSESMSMGPSSVREGLTFSRNSRIKPLVMYSTFQDFKDMTGILKLCNYDYCHVDIPYISYEAKQKYLIIRDEMKLETILLKLNESKSIVESVIDTTETKAKNNDEQITKDEHGGDYLSPGRDDAEYNQSAKTPTVPDPDENLPGNDVHDHDLLD